MAIQDASANINLAMQEALIVAMTELFQSASVEDAARLVDYISKLRDTYNLFHLNSLQLTNNLWSEMRHDAAKNTIPDLMHTTISFLMELEAPSVGFRHLAERLVPYSNLSTIVDKELIGKSPKLDDLVEYFANNEWLFFMVFASLNMRLVNSVMVQFVPKPMVGKNKP